MIRKADITDAANIAAISRETFIERYAAENTAEDMELFLTRQFNVEMLMAEVENPKYVFLLAYESGQLVGYCKLSDATHECLQTKQAIEISRIYVRKAFIGKGYGKALLLSALDYAKANGKEKIWLGVWEKNDAAIAFYQSFSFRQFSTQLFLLGTDQQCDWLMERRV